MRADVRALALATTLWAGAPAWAGAQAPAASEPVGRTDTQDEHSSSRITDEVIPLQIAPPPGREGLVGHYEPGANFPQRPKPILEIGPHFLGTSNIPRGFTIPGGAVWTPSFLLFGTFRTGVSVLNTEATQTTRTTQWANRLDLFGNLYLTASERFVFGLRPTDETDPTGVRRFSGYTSTTANGTTLSASNEHFNFNWRTVSTLFFEGDIGELFPAIDLRDSKGLDIGFSVGRQPINFQEGLLINDTIDSISLTQTSFKAFGSINFRVTGLFGWNEINRHTPAVQGPLTQNAEATRSRLIGAFTEMDTRGMTSQFDAVYVRGDEFSYTCARATDVGCAGRGIGGVVTAPATAGVYYGASFNGRPGGGTLNVILRVLGSAPVGDQPEPTAASPISNPATKGTLLFAELSRTPHHSDNYYYGNFFYAVKQYRAAALDPTIPGPLARAGVLFAGPGLGAVPGALAATANDVTGGAFGYQIFSGQTRRQLLVEVGGRYSTLSCPNESATCAPHAFAGGARYQIAVGRRAVIVLDAFVARDALRGLAAQTRDSQIRTGGRTELLIKF